jgi:hypothetical protein
MSQNAHGYCAKQLKKLRHCERSEAISTRFANHQEIASLRSQ